MNMRLRMWELQGVKLKNAVVAPPSGRSVRIFAPELRAVDVTYPVSFASLAFTGYAAV